MYGLIHIAIRDFVRLNHGEAAWQSIAEDIGAEESLFNNMQPYDDEVTFGLVGAASQILQEDVGELLREFGKHWVLKTAEEGYGPILAFAGQDFSTFLRNLNAMHEQVAMTFVNLNQPSFEVIEEQGGELIVEYRSVRPGLSTFVIGLLEGLGERFDQRIEVQQLSAKADGAPCDTFKVTCLDA
jgi:hypothetical protein